MSAVVGSRVLPHSNPNFGDRAVAGILTSAKVAAAIATVTLLYMTPAPTFGFIGSSCFTINTAQETRDKTLERAVAAAYVIAVIGFALSLIATGAGSAFYLTAHAINLTSFAYSVYTRANLWYQASLR